MPHAFIRAEIRDIIHNFNTHSALVAMFLCTSMYCYNSINVLSLPTNPELQRTLQQSWSAIHTQMDVPTPNLLPPELLPAASMAAQKEVITWKCLTPSASKSKTQKLKAPNKLDTTLQKEILLRRRNLGISWEKQIYPKDYYSSITPRHKRLHSLFFLKCPIYNLWWLAMIQFKSLPYSFFVPALSPCPRQQNGENMRVILVGR